MVLAAVVCATATTGACAVLLVSDAGAAAAAAGMAYGLEGRAQRWGQGAMVMRWCGYAAVMLMLVLGWDDRMRCRVNRDGIGRVLERGKGRRRHRGRGRARRVCRVQCFALIFCAVVARVLVLTVRVQHASFVQVHRLDGECGGPVNVGWLRDDRWLREDLVRRTPVVPHVCLPRRLVPLLR